MLCSLGPQGNENFLLVQKGRQLFVQLRSGLGMPPTVLELGEITLGKPHYVSFACQEGKLAAALDGVEVSVHAPFENIIDRWEEGPLVVGAGASGKRAWRGEIAALAIFDQFVDKSLSDANRKRFQQLHP